MKRLMQLKMPIASVAKVISGYAFKSSEFGDQGIAVIKIKNIQTGNIDLSDTEYVSDQYLSLDSKYHVRSEDILISLTGSHVNHPNSVVGRVARYPRGLGIALLNQRAGKVIVKDPDRCDKSFLYYHLFDEQTRREIAALAHGAANQANVSPSQIESIKINLPSHANQKKIGVVLSAYDDLIENNIRRIKILQEMAQSLYREWFVKFRFQGHQKVKMVNSPLGKIPEGWTVGNIGDLVEEQKDRNRGANSSPVLTVKNTKKFIHSAEYFSKRVYSKSLKNYKVVRRGDFAYNPSRINIGSIAFQEDYEIGVVSPMYIVFSAKVELVGGHFLWMLLQQEEIYRQIVHLCSGTVRQIFKFKDFSLVKTVIPSKKVQSMFEEIVAPIQSQIKTLAVIVENLRQTRDLLLPKLISGELDVSELDITIPEANA